MGEHWCMSYDSPAPVAEGHYGKNCGVEKVDVSF